MRSGGVVGLVQEKANCTRKPVPTQRPQPLSQGLMALPAPLTQGSQGVVGGSSLSRPRPSSTLPGGKGRPAAHPYAAARFIFPVCFLPASANAVFRLAFFRRRPPSPPKTPRAARQTAPAAPHPRPLSPKNHQTPAHDPHSCPLTRIYVCSVVYTTYCNILFPVLSR